MISSSVMLIGERSKSKLVWIQQYDVTQVIEEEDLRMLLRELKTHILKNRIKSGSARKFLDGKLIYYETQDISLDKSNKVYCLYTKEIKIDSIVKKAMQAIAHRGGNFGVYSAKRFFSEIIDLLLNPENLENNEELQVDEVLDRISNYHTHTYDINQLGKLISILNRSTEMDQNTLEMIYLLVYESINALNQDLIKKDPDEFLDASYILARRFQQINNFHLALELYKNIIPVAKKNNRSDLEIICRIRISTIYKNNFPQAGEYILDILSPIKFKHLVEAAQTHQEIYYCLLGYAQDQLNDQKKAIEYYNQAITKADVSISSPKWIAEAYDYLGQIAHNNYFLMEAARNYLTAATLAFSSGDLTLADVYRNNAAIAENNTSYSLIHTALTLRMEGNIKDAEYRAWDALRFLVRSFIHSKTQSYSQILDQAIDILNEAEIILRITGRMRKNSVTLRKIRSTLEELSSQDIDPSLEDNRLEELSRLVEENIPIPPPTFMLLTIDGRLILLGKIFEKEWVESDIEGSLLSGILSAIMTLISEVSEKTSLRTIDAGSFQIMIEQSENVAAVLLVDRDIPELRQRLVASLNHIDENYGELLKYWDGHRDKFYEIKQKVVEFISDRSLNEIL